MCDIVKLFDCDIKSIVKLSQALFLNNQINESLTLQEERLTLAEELFKQGFYAASLVEMGKVIEISLQKRLLEEQNIDVKRYNLYQLLNLALKSKLIDSNQVDSINEIRTMRNKAAHLDVNFSNKDAKWALKETNRILGVLDPKNKWN